MTLNRLFYITLLFAAGMGLFNLYFWFQIPEGTLLPMGYSSEEGFHDYASKTKALIVLPIIILANAGLLKAVPFFKSLHKKIETSLGIIAAVWIGVFSLMWAFQIVIISNPQT